MTDKSKVIIQKERQVHTYSELWHASECVLKSGRKNQEGSQHQFLSCIILMAFTFEAYLNHVGPRTFECWEKHLDRLPPLSKFELLCEKLNIKFQEGAGARPLQTVIKLFEFRNTIAHGRSVEIKSKPEIRSADQYLDAYLGEQPMTKWEQLIRNSDFALRVQEDILLILTKLQEARTDEKEYLFSFGTGMNSATLIEK
jgi:hypothetical protein